MSNYFTFPNFVTTYAKILLSNWSALTPIIVKHTALLKKGGAPPAEGVLPHVLSEREIQDALQGPYSTFFTQKLHAFSIVMHLEIWLQINKEDTLKESLSPSSKLQIDAKRINNLSTEALSNIEDALNELLNKHSQQWEGQLFFWQASITTALKELNLSISQMESEEFASAEPLSELLDRYTSLSLTPPSVDYPLSFADYFKLKAYLLILSALGRQQLPHTEKDIEKYMKHLRKAFSAIDKAEKELAAQQKTETQQLMHPIQFAAF